MAQMHPDDIEDYEDATEGEKRVFRFIKEAARPMKWQQAQGIRLKGENNLISSSLVKSSGSLS